MNSKYYVRNIQNYRVNLRRIISHMLKKWYLFIIFGILGLIAGFLYVNYSNENYQVWATLYVPRMATGIEAGFEGLLPDELMENQSELYHQMEILKSYSLHCQVADNLQWNTSLFKRERLSPGNLMKGRSIFRWVFCYKEVPFIIESNVQTNLTGIRLFVRPIDRCHYRLSSSFKIIREGKTCKVNFDSIVRYDHAFTNEYFHFRLHPTKQFVLTKGCHYSFIFNNTSQIASYFRSKLRVGLNNNEAEIIRLQLSEVYPLRAIDYLNELIHVYMAHKVNLRTTTQQLKLHFIEQQLTGMSDSLCVASTQLSKYKSKSQMINVNRQGSQIISLLQEQETKKINNQRQLNYYQNLMLTFEQSTDIEEPLSLSIVGIPDETFNKLILKLGQIISRRQVLSFAAIDNNPALTMIDGEIAQVKAALKENLSNLIFNAQVYQNTLDKQHRITTAHLNALPQKEQYLENYKRHYELTNETYTYLLHQRSELEIALAGATSDVKIIDPACPHTTSLTGRSPRFKILMGLLSGLAFPGVLVLGSIIMSSTILYQEDLEEHTTLPLLGNIIHSKTVTNTPVLEYPNSAIAESYRHLRTNLQFMVSEREKNIIGIHSINPGEGKSFTSVNLAIILAINSKRVILVSCDMRKPRLHKVFHLPNDHGLSTFLSGQDKLENIIFDSGVENLTIIPAGPFPPNPTELLDTPRMVYLLKHLSNSYDFVLMDNAPVSLVSDALVTGRQAGLNIFILRYGISRMEQIDHINQLAKSKQIGNVTLLMNDMKGVGFGLGIDYNNQYFKNGYDKEPPETTKGIKRRLGIKKFSYKNSHHLVG